MGGPQDQPTSPFSVVTTVCAHYHCAAQSRWLAARGAGLAGGCQDGDGAPSMPYEVRHDVPTLWQVQPRGWPAELGPEVGAYLLLGPTSRNPLLKTVWPPHASD